MVDRDDLRNKDNPEMPKPELSKLPKVSKEEIISSARKIMDEFMMEMSKFKTKDEGFGEERESNKREKMQSQGVDEDFINRFFRNAPRKDYGFIIVDKNEKKK